MTTRGAVTVACTELPGVAVTLRHVSTLGREELDALRAREQRWAAVDRRAQASLEARADLEAYAFAVRACQWGRVAWACGARAGDESEACAFAVRAMLC